MRAPFWSLLVLIVSALVALPVLTVILSLAEARLDVWSHLAETVLGSYVLNSLLLMLGVGAGVCVGGVGTAWLVTMCRLPGHRVLEWALLLPMAMPAYVVAYTYTGLLDYAGPVQSGLRLLFGWQSAREYWFPELRSLGGAIWVMVMVLYPYVYMLARAAFLEQSVCVLEVSRTLGRTGVRAFFHVALPLARPAVVAGMALALMETLNDFGTVHYFAVDTFTTGIYRTWLALGDAMAAAQLGALLLVFIVSLVVTERWSRGARRYHHTTGRYRPLPRLPLSSWQQAAALLFCLLPVLAGFAVPAAMLLLWAVEGGAGRAFQDGFAGLALNSLLLAGLAGLVAVTVALLMAYARRLSPSWPVIGGVRLASMGYAIPGSVLAVGILLPLTALDRWLVQAIAAMGGGSMGLILTGSVAGLVYAYVARFLAVAVNGVDSSLGKVTPSMEAAARTLGENSLGTLRRIHLPIMRGSLLSAGLLVFVDVMKELPATLIMRPFNFDTLATRTFTLASDERLADAAAPALAIVLVGLLPVITLSRAIARSRPGESS